MGVEGQSVLSELGDLTAHTQALKAEHRVGSRRDGEVQVRRGPLEQLAQLVQQRSVRHEVQVLDDEHRRRQPGQVLEERLEEVLAHRETRGVESFEGGAADAVVDLLEHLHEVAGEAPGVAVARFDGEPGGAPVGMGTGPERERHRLP